MDAAESASGLDGSDRLAKDCPQLLGRGPTGVADVDLVMVAVLHQTIVGEEISV